MARHMLSLAMLIALILADADASSESTKGTDAVPFHRLSATRP